MPATETGGWGALVGQEAAVGALRAAARRPVHAYLFTGPPGTGKMAAARAFGAMLLCPDGGDDGCPTCLRVEAGVHPDFIVMEREGASMSIDQAREVARIAARSSLEGGPCVVVLPDLHLAADAAPALLKTVEEPAAQVVFIGLAEFVPPELVTIASRCARVEFRPLAEGTVVQELVNAGVGPERAVVLADMAGGRLDRARLLATDPAADARHRAWAALPGQLDGTGATVARLVDQLLDMLKASAGPLAARQKREAEELAAAQAAYGRAAYVPPKDLEDRHRREQRRQRADETRAGLAVLVRAYRERALSGAMTPEQAAAAVRLVDVLSADLAYNPGEQLALQALLVKLDRLG